MDGHIVRTFDGDLLQLKMRVLEMGGLAIEQVRRAVHVLIGEHDEDAHGLIAGHQRIGAYQGAIEDDALTLIARRQPVATDLRLILTVTKVALELERIGNAGKKIARLGLELHRCATGVPLARFYRDVRRMESIAVGMVREALDCLDRADPFAAQAVVRRDADMDSEFHLAMRDLLTYAMEDSRWVGHTIQTVFVLKALERVGDHARNIAALVPRLAAVEIAPGHRGAQAGAAIGP